MSTIAYFFIGYGIAYGVNFFAGAETLAQKNGYELVKFFFLLTFAAAIPAIVSGGIAERARFNPQLAATFLLVGFVYPFFEGIAWNQHFGVQAWLKAAFGEEFHDFAGSVVVHAVGGWIGLAAVLLLGARRGRYSKDGGDRPRIRPRASRSSRSARGSYVGWFGFNVMSAQTLDKIIGLVGDQLADGDGGRHAGRAGRRHERPGLRPQRPARRPGRGVRRLRRDASAGRAGRPARSPARCSSCMFTLTQNRWKIDDVLGVWPLHGLCGAWGGIAAGIFGSKALGGMGGVAFGVAARRHAAGHRDRAGRRLRWSTARSRRRSACASTPRRNSTAPTSPSTRSPRRRSASRRGEPARRGAPYVRAR